MSTLRQDTIATLREHLPNTASGCVEAIIREVPGYDREFGDTLRANIEAAVAMALAAFLDTLGDDGDTTSATAMRTGAYRLGQGEAETGRSSDALLTAYRVGAREAWTHFAERAVAQGESAASIASLAAGTFAFIDELSVESLAGHTAAMTARTRELARRRDQLAAAFVAGDQPDTLEHLAERAHWSPPRTLTALALTGDAPAAVASAVGEKALWSRTPDGSPLVLVPDLPPGNRARVLAACATTTAALGPTLAWSRAAESVTRARRALRFARVSEPADADTLLPELILDADPLIAQMLRERALAPLADVSEAKRAVLAETLLAWLLHHGRREEVAEALHVHPQTVRYRLGTLREHYGDTLTDARTGLELTLGLIADRSRTPQ